MFPHVSLFLENHVGGRSRFSRTRRATPPKCAWIAGEPAPEESHFFVAVCANRPQIGEPDFVYVPRAGNVLRERERHIGLLEAGTRRRRTIGWPTRSASLARNDAAVRQVEAQLEAAIAWAERLNQEVEARRARVAELQEELAREQRTRAKCRRVRGQGARSWRSTSRRRPSGPATT